MPIVHATAFTARGYAAGSGVTTVGEGGGADVDDQRDRVSDRPTRGNEQGGGTDGSSRSPRKIVLFADGTGNAFTKQESNVWRLYEALDRTKPDQITYYIKGVGTAGWAPLAALDGATGIGVPSNVRKLYRFLCWNWQPGDRDLHFRFQPRFVHGAHARRLDRIARPGPGRDRRHSGLA